MAFLALARLFAECFLQLYPDYLGEVCTLWFPFFGVGLTCAPIPFDRSTVFVITAAVMRVVTFVWPPMFLA